MKVKYDPVVNQALVYLREVEAGGIKETIEVTQGPAAGRMWLDFDPQGRLVSIEVLGATHYLPAQILENAEVDSTIWAAEGERMVPKTAPGTDS